MSEATANEQKSDNTDINDNKPNPQSDTGTVDNSASASASEKNDNVDSASVKSDGKEKVVRPSGIKPPAPSRIGRPCAGVQKPGLPPTPVKSESHLFTFIT